MAKFIILNFDETDRFRLTTERPDISLASSAFDPAKPGAFSLPEEGEAVFLQLIGLNPVKDLGHDAAPALSRFVEEGGKIVCFIGPSDQAELGKLIGPFPELHFQPNSLPESIFFNPDEPYQAVFDEFQMSVSHAYKLLPADMAGDTWEGSPKLSRATSVLAKSSDGCPVALLLPQGRGAYALLPWFGTNNIDVVSTLIKAFEKKAAPAPRPDVAPAIPEILKPPPLPDILPSVEAKPAPEEAPEVAAEPPSADKAPEAPAVAALLAEKERGVPDVSKPAAEPETPRPAESEPAPEEAPEVAAEPPSADKAPEAPAVAALLAEKERGVPDVSKPAAEPETPPPAESEPVPEEAPEVAAEPPSADKAPEAPAVAAPIPEPEMVPPMEIEPLPDVPVVKGAASPPAEEPLPTPVPSAAAEPEPVPAPDKVPVPSIPDLVAGSDEPAWLSEEEYALPELREIHTRRDEETQRHAQAMQEIEQQLQAFRDSGQEAFLDLLRAEGPELTQAVVYVLQYLGWNRVVDVHEYWKKVIRAKEEDIWVMDSESPSVEAALMRDKLLIVLVRSGDALATDEECALMQRYKGRRMQEYGNTQMKALLIGNYFVTAEGKQKTNPFSPSQVEEAQKDGNALLSTYDLFRAVKAEKEGRVTKEKLRGEIFDKTGLIRFGF